ncbi:hypothetical protein COT97_05260 [Candidatus Falkowbacteria bacterium CG10_big_fil_rev_8_21_14_0_10_39_11]|uniref:histidine kinase n=1 Tax=Candidatus Falkowbacteria bacterium CG10_big_fil_rev_8_21_14_0_10_39_11 TaxID=1974565 RepID=A0A2H0V3I0_9BACT|nr:MAG: hypothetical protein COT97_05260 [Candidatus Falkowbacteria bacterium CG10_big_fil_rev_8_21_14_0_10_39_11]
MGKIIKSIENEKKYQAVFQSVNDIILIFDSKGKIIDANSQVHKISGIKPKDIIGKNIRTMSKYVPKEFLALVLINFAKRLAGKKIKPYQIKIIGGDGKLKDFEVSATKMKASHGVGGVLAVLHDITDQKLLESQLMQYRFMVEQSTQEIAVADLSGKIIFVNDAWAKNHGYTKKYCIGQNLSIFHPKEETENIQKFNQILIKKGRYRGEVMHKRKDGSTYQTVMDNFVLEIDEKQTYIVGIAINISVEKAQQQEIEASRKHLAEAQELAHIGSWYLDIPSGKLTWSAQVYPMFNLTRDHLTYKKFLSLVHPDDRQYVNSSWQAAIHKKPYDIEHRIIINSQVRWVRERADIKFDVHGKAISATGTVQDITKQKDYEYKILAEKERTELYLKIVGSIVAILDHNGFIIMINDKGNEVLGYKHGELIGQNWFETCLPKRLQRDVRKVFDQLMAGDTKQVEYYENPVLTKNGKERIIAFHNSILKDENKKNQSIIFSGEDITEKKLAETKLKENEEKLRTLTQNVDGMFYRGHVDGIAEFTSGAEDLCGYTEHELENEIRWFELIDPRDQKKIQSEEQKMTQRAMSLVQEYRIKTKNGNVKWVSDTKTSVFKDGHFQGIDGIVMDITGRKESEAALIESQEKFKTLAETSPDCIKLFDLKQNIEYINSSGIKEHYLKSPKHASSWNWLSAIQPKYIPAAKKAFLRAKKGLKSEIIVHHTPEGAKHDWCQMVLRSVKDSSGNIVRVFCVSRNISELKQHEIQLEESEKNIVI